MCRAAIEKTLLRRPLHGIATPAVPGLLQERLKYRAFGTFDQRRGFCLQTVVQYEPFGIGGRGFVLLTLVPYTDGQVVKLNTNLMVHGGPRRIRTPDPLIRSQVLYPAELSVRPGRFTLAGAALQPLN